MYSYYKNYKEFLDEYPRFKFTLISFYELKTRIPRIRKWFLSEECLALKNDNIKSTIFWKMDTSPLYKSPKFAMDTYQKLTKDNMDYNPNQTDDENSEL